MTTPILYLDLDGTVRQSVDDELGRFVNGPEDVRVFPEAVTMMRRWREEKRGLCIGVTNQGGIARGFVTREQVHAAFDETNRQCEGLLLDVFYCDHDPSEGCWCRKPMPSLISAPPRAYMSLRSFADVDRARPAECLMVGDMDSDRECAERAGVPFKWARDWRAEA